MFVKVLLLPFFFFIGLGQVVYYLATITVLHDIIANIKQENEDYGKAEEWENSHTKQ